MNQTIAYYIESFFILGNLCFFLFLSSCSVFVRMFTAVAIALGCQTFQIWSFSVTDSLSPGVLFSLNFHTQVDSVVPLLNFLFLIFTFKSFFHFFFKAFSKLFQSFFKIFTLLYHKFAISYKAT